MAGADSFVAGTTAIGDRVGHGALIGHVGFGRDLADYAIPQHRAHWDNYYNPGLGRHTGPKDMNQPRSHYLSRPLKDGQDGYWQDLADRIIGEGGQPAMQSAVDHLKGVSVAVAPERSGALKRSVFTDVEG